MPQNKFGTARAEDLPDSKTGPHGSAAAAAAAADANVAPESAAQGDGAEVRTLTWGPPQASITISYTHVLLRG